MRWLAPFLCLFLSSVFAQEQGKLADDTYEQRRGRAFVLFNSHSPKTEDALKALLNEKPTDREVLLRLAITVHSRGLASNRDADRQAIFKESRGYFLKAKEAGSTDPVIMTALAAINADGTENLETISANPSLDVLLRKAEIAFGQKKFTDAITHFIDALKIDPRNYQATLHLGDTYFASGDFEKAVDFFTKASEIAPNAETPYRYKADALMRMRRKDEAIAQYVEAVVAEPYNGYPWRGIQSACQSMLLKPWSPAAKIPVVDVRIGPKGPQIKLPPDSSQFQLIYALARAKWQTENLTNEATNGQVYRQTITEEVEALRGLLIFYSEVRENTSNDVKMTAALKEFGPSLDQLKEIEAGGFLEAHILFFRANQDIALDYPSYREKNREKLRAYLIKHYLHL